MLQQEVAGWRGEQLLRLLRVRPGGGAGQGTRSAGGRRGARKGTPARAPRGGEQATGIQ